ncbi:hypothetical protein [Streptomyces sp. NPDC051546]|uniref:hypothetical protein n=1 Tax=Streptomyces sp. NPDC051546 TaxID=3365655 RepID=UPI00378BEEE9
MNAAEILVPTPELKAGDIVHTWGARVLLEGEPNRAHGITNADVYHWNGLVLNVEEVRKEGTVPLAWLYGLKRNTEGWELDLEAGPHWVVQGNEFVSWWVERSNN